MLTPTLSHLQIRTAQRIWFEHWNRANLAARVAYETRLAELAERDRAAVERLNRAKLREARITPEMCKENKHKLTEKNTRWSKEGYYRCGDCVNAKNTEARRRKGIKPQGRFSLEESAELRRRYESGQTAQAIAKQEGCSHTAVVRAVLRAGGVLRTRSEDAKLQHQKARERRNNAA